LPLLKDVRSREPVDLTPGLTTRLRFDGVLVKDTVTGQEVFLQGPVDLAQYETLTFTGTNPTSGQAWTREGVGFHAVQENGFPVDKVYRAVGVRFIQQLRGDLENGSYLKTEYAITPVGDPPRTTYQIQRSIV